jgi:Molybdopterin converting factor, small subunit
LKLLYFAWIRDDIGLDGEEISLPDGVKTVGELITLLKSQGDSYERGLRGF